MLAPVRRDHAVNEHRRAACMRHLGPPPLLHRKLPGVRGKRREGEHRHEQQSAYDFFRNHDVVSL